MKRYGKYLFLVVLLVAIFAAAVFVMEKDAENTESEEQIMEDESTENERWDGGEQITEKVDGENEGVVISNENTNKEAWVREGDSIDNKIPFTSQAPLANWSDPVFQNACEEASLLMAKRFSEEDMGAFDPQEATEAIRELTKQEQALVGEHRDLSADDTARVAREILSLDAEVEEITSSEDIVEVLRYGAIAIVPVNGRLLENPHFTPPGPLYHMLLIRGYDFETEMFIANDPGTRFGAGYHYSQEILFNTLHDYETGYHGEVFPEKKVMVVVTLPKE
jgi:hypothetical protein